MNKFNLKVYPLINYTPTNKLNIFNYIKNILLSFLIAILLSASLSVLVFFQYIIYTEDYYSNISYYILFFNSIFISYFTSRFVRFYIILDLALVTLSFIIDFIILLISNKFNIKKNKKLLNKLKITNIKNAQYKTVKYIKNNNITNLLKITLVILITILTIYEIISLLILNLLIINTDLIFIAKILDITGLTSIFLEIILLYLLICARVLAYIFFILKKSINWIIKIEKKANGINERVGISSKTFLSKYPIIKSISYKNKKININLKTDLKIFNCLVCDYTKNTILHKNLMLKNGKSLNFSLPNKERNLIIVLNSNLELVPILKIDFIDEKFENYSYKNMYTKYNLFRKFLKKNV